MDTHDILNKLFSQEKQLPTLPVIFNKLNQMLADPKTPIKNISDLIMKDQAMVIKILKLCNSPLYGLRQEVRNVAQAINLMGLNTIKQVVLQVSLVKVFHFQDPLVPDFDITTFWEHSLGAAYFTEVIAKQLKLPPNENYYVAGLLHDVGKLVIYQLYPNKFMEMVKLQVMGGLTDTDAETKVMGVNHNEVGGYLASRWNFHPEIASAITNHHNNLAGEALFVAVVQIANMFARTAGLCFSWDNRFFDVIGLPAWEVIARSAGNIEVDTLVRQILSHAASIRASVRELLGVR